MNNLIIENNIVRGCTDKDILKIEIPEGVVAIGDNAFSDFDKLYDVTFPCSLVKIGSNAFKHCVSIKSIDIKNVNFIGEYAFSGCSSLHDITFGENIGYLCNGTFLGCSSIEEIVIPKNITYIGCECFRDCTSLSSVDIKGAMEIDNNAFEHCTNIYNINFPHSLIHISSNAFSFCENLKTVVIQNKFIDIDETAFEYDVNIIIKAVQFSTAYNYTQQHRFSFCPTILDSDYRVISSEELSRISKAGILIRAKQLDASKDEMLIIFDKSAKERIDSLIGGNKDG